MVKGISFVEFRSEVNRMYAYRVSVLGTRFRQDGVLSLYAGIKAIIDEGLLLGLSEESIFGKVCDEVKYYLLYLQGCEVLGYLESDDSSIKDLAKLQKLIDRVVI